MPSGSAGEATFTVRGDLDPSFPEALKTAESQYSALERLVGKKITFGLEDLGKAVAGGANAERLESQFTGVRRAIEEAREKARGLADPADWARVAEQIKTAEAALAELSRQAGDNTMADAVRAAEAELSRMAETASAQAAAAVRSVTAGVEDLGKAVAAPDRPSTLAAGRGEPRPPESQRTRRPFAFPVLPLTGGRRPFAIPPAGIGVRNGSHAPDRKPHPQ